MQGETCDSYMQYLTNEALPDFYHHNQESGEENEVKVNTFSKEEEPYNEERQNLSSLDGSNQGGNLSG